MPASRDCARQVVETVPVAMRLIRSEMRLHCGNQLSVPQFRTLAFLYREPGASLSQVAGHLGVTPPTVSKIVDRLVERGLVQRRDDPRSRRRLILSATGKGRDLFENARERTTERIAERLDGLAPSDLAAIQAAMGLFDRVLRPGAT
ncbi:MAG: MarR family transcriptional regulator [Firmicutes bacterium]|nr:MarR family transcriptional regulator [Bacillota bacterium]